jgi:hypothetical protein
MFFIVSITCLAQSAKIGGHDAKTLLAVPMIGSGTWEDPKRPAFVRESGVPFRYELSDDGKMALVEASPRNLAEMAKLSGLIKTDARSKLFLPGKDKKADVEAEFKKLKKDFNAESFGKPGPALNLSPVPTPTPGQGK